MNELLDNPTIESLLLEIPGWQVENKTLCREYTLKNFAEALAFVNAIGVEAEAKNHHPDLSIRWNRVGIRLTTHSRGGLTRMDFQLAAAIEKLAESRIS